MLQALGFAAGASYASGMKLYATLAVLGILQRFGFVRLPSSLDFLANPIVIALAVALFAVEFFIDKIPYAGSVWNAFHTFIRPPAAAVLSYAAFTSAPSHWRVLAALLGGGIAFSSHSLKTALRTPLEASPEPFSTSSMSLGEDGLAGGLTWLAAAHPLITIIVVTVLLGITSYLMVKLYRVVRRNLGRVARTFHSRLLRRPS